MNRAGGVKKTFKIDDSTEGVEDLHNNANYGSAITNMGDLNGDGNITIAVNSIPFNSNEGVVYLSDIQFICTPPSLEQKLGQFDPTYIDKATFRVDFREPINPTNNFTAGDITLTVDGNAQAGTIETIKNIKNISPLIENKARVFEFTVTGMTAGDTVTASLDAGKVEYSNETSNLAATSIDATVHYMGPIGCGALGLGEVPTRITSNITLSSNENYGSSIANIGDLDRDGITDIAVGTYIDNTERTDRGAVYIHFMNSDGNIRETKEITSGTHNGLILTDDTNYGSSIANIGDLDGDGIVDIAVGDAHNGTGGIRRGAVYIHFMNRNGSVKKTHKIASGTDDNGPDLSNYDTYGSSIANIGDLNGDGITDIAVGTNRDDMGGHVRDNIGAVYIHFMNSDGSVKQTQKISTDTTNGPNLSNRDFYGSSIANIGDLNGDGVIDIAVGAVGDEDTNGVVNNRRGAIYIHLLNIDENGTIGINNTIKIDDSENTPNGPYLTDNDRYGSSIANIGDINGDGITDIAVGAIGDDTGGDNRGAVYIHFMNRDGTVKKTFKIDDSTEGVDLPNNSKYGKAITNMGDPNGDGNITIAVGSNEAIYLSEIQFVCTPPSLEQKLGQFDPTYIDKATFRVDFREPINPDTFIAEDIILAGTTGTVTSLEKVSPLNENRVFEFTVTGMTAGDTVTASLEAGKVDYSNGTTNLEATSIDATVHYMGPIGCGALGLGEVPTNRITSNIELLNNDYYGSSIANIGDLDRDGITDIAVGTYIDNTDGTDRGAVYIHFMNSDGGIRETEEINNDTTNGPNLTDDTNYGSSIANIGDLDGDGIVDIAVGDAHNGTGGIRRGAVYIHFMKKDGSVKQTRKITSGTDNGPNLLDWDTYGSSIANIGDLNGDGITDIAVGAGYDDTEGNNNKGIVYIHFMDSNGTVKQTQEIPTNTTNNPTLSDRDLYGSSIANIGDLDGDGIVDIAVGAPGFHNNTYGDNRRGAIYIHLLNIDGNGTIGINNIIKIDDSGNTPNGPSLTDDDRYGSSIANIGDINGDGITDIAVGAIGDDTGGNNRGAVYIHFMNSNGTVKKTFKIDNSTLNINFPNHALYGRAITNMGDPNGDGTITIAVGSNEAIYLNDIQFICLPTPSLEQKLGQFDPTYIDKATFRVDFREPINPDTFTVDDIRLTSATGTGTVSNLRMVSPLNENRVFEFTVTGMTAGDTVTASLPANMVEYPNGTTNLAATSIDATVRYMGPINCGALGLGEVPTNRITSNINLSNGDNYGYSIANIGDLDGDHIVDIVVGAYGDNTGGENRGAVYIHFMDRDGTVKENGIHKIASGTNDNDWYGYSIANIGDLDGDGIVDIAVGARYDDTGGVNRGAIYIHFMNDGGNVKQTRKIANGTDVNGPTLINNDRYGSSIANIGDLNGDGIVDIVVGAMRDNTEGNSKGAVYIHFMNIDGSIKGTKEISSTTPNGPDLSNRDWYGSSIANIGDLNRDGITDIAVGAVGDNTGGNDRGIVYIHFMNVDGTIDKTEEISNTTPNGPNLLSNDNYGSSIANIGDLNGDGITDIAVGAIGDDTGGNNRGAVYIHFMNSNGTVKKTFKIDDSTEGVNLLNNANYGRAITNMGNPDGDGNITMGVGTAGVDSNKGAVYLSEIQFVCIPPSLEQKLGQFDPTYIDKATFTVDFREPIDRSTFTVDDIRLTVDDITQIGTTETIKNIKSVSPLNENRVFEFTVTGMTPGDTVTASLATDRVKYFNVEAPNLVPNIATTSIDATVRYAEPYKCGVPVFDIVSNRKIDKDAVSDISANNYYGSSIANIGDLDRDGITDIAVGAYINNTVGTDRGAIYIHFMNSDGSIRQTKEITQGTPNGPNLTNDTNYGSSIANIGDLDEDGIVDIAVGDEHNGTGGIRRGAVYIHFMDSTGTVKKTRKIASGTDGYGPNLLNYDTYGSSIANIGDLNGDGITDIAVGARHDDMGGNDRGTVYIHFMNSNGTVKQTQEINNSTTKGPTLSDRDLYGSSIANIGDLNGDNIIDIAVGAPGFYDNISENNRGAIYIHLLKIDENGNIGIKDTFKIEDNENKPNSPYLTNGDRYGVSIANMGDLDSDGIVDIVVGAVGDDATPLRETLYLHFLRTNGSIKSTAEINKNTINNSTYISQGDHYGCSIANMGDPDGDGFMDMVVGARKTNSNDGAVYFSGFGMYCPKYMRHGKYFLNGTLRFKKSLR